MLQKILSFRLIRFGAVGGVVTLFFMGLNLLLTKSFGMSPVLAFLVAYPPALFVHFTLNKLWTFGDSRTTSSRHLAEYFFSVVVTFLIQWPSFLILQRILRLPGWVAAGGANVVQMAASYALLRIRVFNKTTASAGNARESWHRLILLVCALALAAFLTWTAPGKWVLGSARVSSDVGNVLILVGASLCASWLWLRFLRDRYPNSSLAVKLVGMVVLAACGEVLLLFAGSTPWCIAIGAAYLALGLTLLALGLMRDLKQGRSRLG